MSSCTAKGSVPTIRPTSAHPLRAMLGQAIRWLDAALRLARERRDLAALDDRMLKDIGLSRADADREWSRSFLDVPGHRVDRR